MSLLGFDAIGRLAISQNPPAAALPAIFGGSFHIWDPAPRPHNFARDWIEFADNFSVNAPVYTQPFSPFDVPPKPRNFAQDWIAFSGNYYVETTTLSFFTEFSRPPKPPQFAKDWTEYNEIGFTFAPVGVAGLEFTTFSAGLTAKLWTQFGQQPQWWSYYFKPPPFKKRDKHDSGDYIPRWHRQRTPPVYSDEYYTELERLKYPPQPPQEDPFPPEKPPQPNLRIPIDRLIKPTDLPTLRLSPPHRPVPTLTTNPPPFRLASSEEMMSDDEMIIRMLLEE